MAGETIDLSEAISLYLDLAPEQPVDLEVAAAMAIQWSRGIKAAASSVDADYDYRVSLIAAKPGSSNWLARVQRSKINQKAEDVKKGWEEIPLILRWTIALVVVLPTTAIPTWNYYTGQDGFSETQLHQMNEAFEKASKDESVRGHKRSMYREAQRDKKITGIGGGVPDGPNWKPHGIILANQFPQADGLFDLEDDAKERTVPQILDVILVAPDLEKAHKTWVFRQEGIPGTIRAIMKDDRFLEALERSAVREQFRTEIPMTIRLEIKEEWKDGKWKVKRKGRVVTEVIAPETL